jgi:hypothetical protein
MEWHVYAEPLEHALFVLSATGWLLKPQLVTASPSGAFPVHPQ